MTVFDFVNASIAPWTVIRIFAEDAAGNGKDLGSFFKFEEIPEYIQKEEIDAWSCVVYRDDGETVLEIHIYL